MIVKIDYTLSYDGDIERVDLFDFGYHHLHTGDGHIYDLVEFYHKRLRCYVSDLRVMEDENEGRMEISVWSDDETNQTSVNIRRIDYDLETDDEIERDFQHHNFSSIIF